MRERKNPKELYERLLSKTSANTKVPYQEVRKCVNHFIEKLQHYIEIEEPVNIRVPYLGLFHTNEKRFFINKKDNGKEKQQADTLRSNGRED